MKIGIFGGSFNPPHNMHKNIALNLIKNKYLDKVIYVPTGNKYNKRGLVNQNDRYNMVRLMIEGYNNLDVSNYEFNKLTYTYETLDYFRNIYQNDDIYFICGSDNLKEITSWKRYDYILKNYKIIVIKRNDEFCDTYACQFCIGVWSSRYAASKRNYEIGIASYFNAHASNHTDNFYAINIITAFNECGSKFSTANFAIN